MKKHEGISYWLKEGKQSKITPAIKKIANQFKGDDFEKVLQILIWIDKNLGHYKDYNVVEKVFATRTADEIIKTKKHTGCHDVALVFVTLARACKIPAEYIQGLGKESGRGGHCVSEIYLKEKKILIDPSSYKIDIFPEFSEFYKKFYVMGIGLDSWDIKIKTLNDWKRRANEINEQIKKIK